MEWVYEVRVLIWIASFSCTSFHQFDCLDTGWALTLKSPSLSPHFLLQLWCPESPAVPEPSPMALFRTGVREAPQLDASSFQTQPLSCPLSHPTPRRWMVCFLLWVSVLNYTQVPSP